MSVLDHDHRGRNSTINNDEICAVCKVTTKKKCSACNNVYYCSREHQISDWKFHSKNCLPMKLVVDPTIGRRYIATRRIEMDEIVLREEKPFFFIPQPSSCPNCDCFVELDITLKQCDKCGWHLCNDCTKHGPACELTLRYRKKKVNMHEYMLIPNGFLYTIVVMRALDLREKNPDTYKKFLRHESHCIEEAKQSMRESKVSRQHMAIWIKDYMNLHDVEIPEISKIIGVMQINCDTLELPNKNLVAVFDKGSYFEHDCCPNCRKFSTVNGGIIMQAVRTIEKGQPLTVCYFEGMLGSAKRGRSLKDEKFFTCTCERCKDPTELGTMFSAVKCINNNCTGYMLPPTFVVSNEKEISDFICNKCNVTKPSKIIERMIEEMRVEYLIILEVRSETELKKYIVKCEKILHENHFAMTDAKLLLSRILAKDDESTTIEMSKENLTLCGKMNHVLKTLSPNNYYQRGLSLYRMFSSHRHLSRRDLDCPATVYSSMTEEKEMLTEVYRLLRDEPLATGKLIETVLTQLELTKAVLTAWHTGGEV